MLAKKEETKEDDVGRTTVKRADEKVDDEDDVVSDQERENAAELNPEVDGQVKVAKNVRGYDEKDDSDASDKDMKSEIGSEKAEAPAVKSKEATGRFKQYIQSIEFDKASNTATAQIVFPLDFKKVLMLTVAEQTMNKVLVRSVAHIEKCTFVKPKPDSTEEPFLVVQGINFDAFYPHLDIIDVNRIETNHSYALKGKYGVEAMRANIVKEVQMVFGVYGISVDARHLSLISDFMTFNGDYRAFNRIGMDESSSPFLRMSYETTMRFLVAASTTQERDDMSAPSSAVVLGQVPRVGTGMFDLITEKPANL